MGRYGTMGEIWKGNEPCRRMFFLATFGGFVPVMEIDLFCFVWEVVS